MSQDAAIESAGSRDIERAVTELAERLPVPLAPLARIAYDYAWSWTPGGRSLFRDIDALHWRRSGYNARGIIEAQSPHRLRQLASDPGYVRRVEQVAAALAADRARPRPGVPIPPDRPVAYLCAEFGGHSSLPLYGGGLGVLAGDFVKAASDFGLPLVAMSIFYREGSFHQRLDENGQQLEYWTATPIERLPAVLVRNGDQQPAGVSVEIGERIVHVQIWRVDFGRVPLYLLDTDCAANASIDRWITARLYVADRQIRLAQYAVLGCGGVRALRALGIEPSLVHLNEGHAALSGLERLGSRLEVGRGFEAALAEVREKTVFTTHTPVAAGNEWYAREEVDRALGALREQLGVPSSVFYGLGRIHPGDDNEPVALTPLALRTSRTANGVSRRHGEVAREMWQPLWPGRPVADVPIRHVTNGVHVPTWMATPMQVLVDRYLPVDWRRRTSDPAIWDAIGRIPDAEIWAVRQRLRERLVEDVRERSVVMRLARGESHDFVEAAARVYDPGVLTIGFARRVATYKRLHLLTLYLERGLGLLANRERPIQLLIAGKAHPADPEAKQALKTILDLRRAPNVGRQIVFLEDYDLSLAPRVVAGVDLWLNLPRPPFEASGTSGMKVVLNGGLHLSVLDGWWAEAYDGESGWAIATPPGDPRAQDLADAAALYDLLEGEVVPLFYERDREGIPARWLARVKNSMRRLIPRFSAERMLRDYLDGVYDTGTQCTD